MTSWTTSYLMPPSAENDSAMKNTRSRQRIRAALKLKGYALYRARWERVRWTDCGDTVGGWSVHVRPVADVIVGLNLKDLLWQIEQMPRASK